MIYALIDRMVIKKSNLAIKKSLPLTKSCAVTEAMAKGLGYFSFKTLQEALNKSPVECKINDTAFNTYLAAKGFEVVPKNTMSEAVLKYAYAAIIEDGVFFGYRAPVYVSPFTIEPFYHDSPAVIRQINDQQGEIPFFGTEADLFSKIGKDFMRKIVPNKGGVNFLRRMRVNFGRENQTQ